jgi:hypothetical protein
MTILPKEPLTENELQSIDHFLRHGLRVKDQFSLTHVHGLLCAVVTAPTLSNFDYYSELFHDLADPQEATLHPLIDHRLWIAKLTGEIICGLQQHTFTPFLYENDCFVSYEEASWQLLKDWSQGYYWGMELDSLWFDDKYALELAMPIGVLSGEFNLVGLSNSEGQLIVDDMPHKVLARNCLLTRVANLYQYWQERRASYRESNKKLH